MQNLPALDTSALSTYITTTIGGNVLAVGTAVLTLAAIAMGIRWVKATFF